MTVLVSEYELALETRGRRKIENVTNLTSPHAGVGFQVDDFKTQYPGARHDRVGPSPAYNCHGLTFAARRTQILQSGEVQKILRDDGYQPVDPTKIMPGDVIVYSINGAIEHSGVIVWVDKSGPWILSKWGQCHEPIHRIHDCPYGKDMAISYYRMIVK